MRVFAVPGPVPALVRALTAAVAAALLVAVLAGFGAGAAGAQIDGTVTVTMVPASASAILGDNVDLTIEVTNTGSAPTVPLVVHLDITDPAIAGSVDPEDWTSTLTKPIGVLEPGATQTVDWPVQPISPGTFAAYAVAMSVGADDLANSNVVTIDVEDRRSLNPDGILPVAIATPVVIGGLLVAQTGVARRRRPHGHAPS
jgi:hypothetical protein